MMALRSMIQAQHYVHTRILLQPMSNELWRWDALDLARAIRLRQVSSREVVEAVLDRLASVNPSINAVTVVLAEQALAEADRADTAVARGG